MSDQHKRQIERTQDDSLGQARHAADRGGGLFAAVISGLALVFSGYSFYETVWRAPELAVYVPAQIQYTDPDRPDSPFEVFVIPLTLANHGARSGTVLAIDLVVRNPRTGDTKRFYASDFGQWRAQPRRAFAPVSLAGRAAQSSTVQFVPRIGEKVPRVLDFEAGDYEFTITLRTADGGSRTLIDQIWPTTAAAQPVQFRMQIGKLDYRYFSNAGTMEMWSPDYRPASNVARQ